MRIAVAGGTGAVGRHVVVAARDAGHDPLVLARSTGVDLVTGNGLDLTGVAAVVDVTSTRARTADDARAFFGAVTRGLLAAEGVAGVGHHVTLGIVGSTDAPYDYYAGKALQEELVEAGPVPWTILRATQFHEFAAQIYGQYTVGPIVLVPAMRSQPVAAREVAQRLVELATAAPAGHAPDLAGPREERMVRMTRAWASAGGRRRPILEIPVPGPFGRALRDGTLLPRAGASIGRQTFDEWLAAEG